MIYLLQSLFIKIVSRIERYFNTWIDPLPPLVMLPVLLCVSAWFFSCIFFFRILHRIKRFFKLIFMLPYTRRMFLLREVCAICKHRRYQHEFPYNMDSGSIRCGVGSVAAEVLQHYGMECWCPQFKEREPLDLCDDAFPKKDI